MEEYKGSPALRCPCPLPAGAFSCLCGMGRGACPLVHADDGLLIVVAASEGRCPRNIDDRYWFVI
jgi:hypothetical protein